MGCKCDLGDLTNATVINFVGVDKNFGESIILACFECNGIWLQCRLETEGISNSGRWFAARVDEQTINSITAENTLSTVLSQNIYTVGGSYFGGKISQILNDGQRELIRLLMHARILVNAVDNDFTWSSWIDAADANADIDQIIDDLYRGLDPQKTSVSAIFLPTGPMQELSLSSGWSSEFLKLADKYDEIIYNVRKIYSDGG